jgi:hypothetical protein
MPGWGPRDRPSRLRRLRDRRASMMSGYVPVEDPRAPGRGYAFEPPPYPQQQSPFASSGPDPRRHQSAGPQQQPAPGPRVFYGSPNPLNLTPREIQASEDAMRQHYENQQQGAYEWSSTSASAFDSPSNTNASSQRPTPSASGSSAQSPAHVRNHPRFAEAEYAAGVIGRFGKGDPRAKPYLDILRQISAEMEGCI